MIRELIDKKVDEIVLAYRNAHHITNGDVCPELDYDLMVAKDTLEEAIQVICNEQEKATYEELVPSWYIYTDCDGEFHMETFGKITDNQFFTKVSYKICHNDLDNSNMHKIFFRGKEVVYTGWQRGMKFEYQDLDGNTVWIGCFEDWDH